MHSLAATQAPSRSSWASAAASPAARNAQRACCSFRRLNSVMPAEHLGTSLRFVRRLVFERRIPFVKVGRHVRIAASDLDAFIAAGRIEAGENFLYQVQGRPRPE